MEVMKLVTITQTYYTIHYKSSCSYIQHFTVVGSISIRYETSKSDSNKKKKNDSTLLSNYRPVSILSSFSKILECIVYNRLSSFLVVQKLLNYSQYGFRKFHSTDLALLDLVDKISNALAKKEHVISVFMDLSKAFDTLDHAILISKLEAHYGIRGTALNWFKSYLYGRLQFTCINSVCSRTQRIKYGVPQGSILGPLLFLCK